MTRAASPPHLDVAVVSHHSHGPTLLATLEALAQASARWHTACGATVQVVLLDNSDAGTDAERLRTVVATLAPRAGFACALHVAGRNLGYGAGNNLALEQAALSARAAGLASGDDYVLVLNPDVRMAPDALLTATAHLAVTPAAALLVPRALDAHGRDLHLAHRYPDPWVFLLRGAGPAWLRTRERARLDRYEIRDRPIDRPHTVTVCASGCFLLLRADTWRTLGGFDPRYFLYFEDYDFSCRALALGHIDYRPEVRILHDGGHAARKGWRHRRLFMRSALRFFRTWGWSPRGFERRRGTSR
ncbi:MAG: glycosyltransferase family 2 protein [Burkholderiaceae bacterium]